MTDWSSLILGADLSHWQHRPDFGKLEADGVKYVILKATERMGVDPDFDWSRTEAEKRGMLWLPYPFLRPDDTTATMLHFAKVVGAKVPVALDWEAAGVAAEKVEVWMDNCEVATGRAGLAYYGIYPPTPATRRIEKWPRWLPRYPAHIENGPGLPPWDGKSMVTDWSATWLVWQYTGHGRLPGVPGEIDLNRLACSWGVFKTWYDTGALPAAPPPEIPSDAVLQLHSRGLAVRMLQQRLAALRYHLGVDGDYGPQTSAAVALFKGKAGLKPADGVADLATIAALNAA